MTPTLAWDADGLWLYLHVGPWRFAVADVETYTDGDGTAAHILRGEDDGSDTLHAATVDEARTLIAAVFGVRGVVVPTWVAP